MHCGTQGIAFPSFDHQTWEATLDCGQKIRCYGILFSSHATHQLGGCEFSSQYDRQNFSVNPLDTLHTK
jgi:hypothetical protein